MKHSAKKARKARRKAAAVAASMEAETRRELIPGMFLPPTLQLPKGSKQFLMDYYKQHPDDEWRPKTNMDIAIKAGVAGRVGSLLSSWYILHGVQNMMTSEIESLMDDFGLWIKGIRPAMNHVLQAEDEFFNTMHRCLDEGDDPQGAHQQYMRDFDSFYDKAMHWMRIPKQWHPNEDVRLPEVTEKDRKKAAKNGKLIVDTGWEEMKIGTVEMKPETKKEWTTYCISKLYRDETGEVIKSKIPTLTGAKRMAMKLQRENPKDTYVIYECHNRMQATATLVPTAAVAPNGVTDRKELTATEKSKTKPRQNHQNKIIVKRERQE